MHRRPPPMHPITLLRIAHGLTLDALARRVGVTPGHLGRIVRGVRQPSSQLIETLAELLGTEPGMLVAYPAREASPKGRDSTRGRSSAWKADCCCACHR